eukprot:70742-Pleurochrysis_carterae.AAC.2
MATITAGSCAESEHRERPSWVEGADLKSRTQRSSPSATLESAATRDIPDAEAMYPAFPANFGGKTP